LEALMAERRDEPIMINPIMPFRKLMPAPPPPPGSEPFLSAIAAAPDDEGARLVYADWLLEHGAPAMGEQIQIECRLAKLPADHAERAALEARLGSLRPDPPPEVCVRWDRGFVAGLVLGDDLFVENALALPLLVRDLACHARARSLAPLLDDRRVAMHLVSLEIGRFVIDGEIDRMLELLAEPSRTLPALRELHVLQLASPESWRRLLASPVGTRLERIFVTRDAQPTAPNDPRIELKGRPSRPNDPPVQPPPPDPRQFDPLPTNYMRPIEHIPESLRPRTRARYLIDVAIILAVVIASALLLWWLR
jgi:uncharacterized protein (TIGR02996 family)